MQSMRSNFHYETFGRRMGVVTGACGIIGFGPAKVAGRWAGGIGLGALITLSD